MNMSFYGIRTYRKKHFQLTVKSRGAVGLYCKEISKTRNHEENTQ
jgi:hypothetical protein